MSREGAQQRAEPASKAGTPIWVWVVYGLGLLGACVLVLSALFTVGGVFLSEDSESYVRFSTLGVVLWGGLLALAAGLWAWRRRQRPA